MFDKEQVHIDELIQSRLSNETDGLGVHQAWDKMQQLLDKEEEKKPVAGFWRVNWLLPVILFTIMSGAGLWYYNQSAANKELLAHKPSGHNNAPKLAMHSTNNNATQQEQSDETKTTLTNAAPSNNDKIGTVASNNNTTTNNNSTQSTHKRKSTKNPATRNPTTKVLNSDNDKLSGTQVAINDKGQAVQLTENNVVNLGKKIAMQEQAALQTSNKPLESVQKNMIAAAEAGKLFINPAMGNVITKQEVSNRRVYTVTERSKIENGKTHYYKDTVENGYKNVIAYVPLLETEIMALQQGLAIYAADPLADGLQPVVIKTLREESKQVLASSSNEKGAGTLTKSSSTDALLSDLNNFFEIRKQFYTNVFGGFNSSYSNPFPFGFQAGVGLHYWIGQKWSVGTELGYVFRPMNYTFVDEAATYTQIGAGSSAGSGGTRYNYNEQKTSKYYNVSYIQSFEVPLVFTYHKGNWSYYGGPTLNFGMPIRYQKLESSSSQDKVIIQTGEFNMPSTTLKSTPDDFSARLGLGAMFGFNYSLNKNFGLSFRYNHVIIDSAPTTIGQELSSKMFRSPSIRFGINYKIGRDKNVQYMMDSK